MSIMSPAEELPKSSARFYIVGDLPIQLQTLSDGRKVVLKLDMNTGFFVDGGEFMANVIASPDAHNVTEDDFIQQTERLRRERFKGRATVFTLYEMLNNLEFMAAAQKRVLTEAEQKLIAIAQRKTFQLFETLDKPG